MCVCTMHKNGKSGWEEEVIWFFVRADIRDCSYMRCTSCLLFPLTCWYVYSLESQMMHEQLEFEENLTQHKV